MPSRVQELDPVALAEGMDGLAHCGGHPGVTGDVDDPVVFKGEVADDAPEPLGGLVGVREVDAGARTVGGGRQVVRTGRARRGFLGHGLDLARLIRDAPEPLRRFGGRAGDRGAGTVQQLLTARPAQRRIVAQPPEDLREVVGAEDLRAEFAVFPGELVDDRQAGFVQFQRRPLDGGVHPRQPRVDVGPAGQPGHPAAVGRTPVRRDLRGQNFPVFGESRADDVGEQLLALRREVVVRVSSAGGRQTWRLLIHHLATGQPPAAPPVAAGR